MNSSFTFPILRANSSASLSSRASRSARLCLQLIEALQIGGSDFVGFSGGNQMVAGKALADFYDISLGTQTGEVFFQNDLSVSHRVPFFEKRGRASVHPRPGSVKSRSEVGETGEGDSPQRHGGFFCDSISFVGTRIMEPRTRNPDSGRHALVASLLGILGLWLEFFVLYREPAFALVHRQW